MDYKNNIEDQRTLLENHLNEINIVVSAKLGFKVELKIEEKTNYQKLITFGLIDDRNLKEHCGIMSAAFNKVFIETFGVWWNEKGVVFELDFKYEHIDCGTNGAKFCVIGIEDDIVKIIL